MLTDGPSGSISVIVALRSTDAKQAYDAVIAAAGNFAERSHLNRKREPPEPSLLRVVDPRLPCHSSPMRPEFAVTPSAWSGCCMGGRLALRAAADRTQNVPAIGCFHAGRLVTGAIDSPHRLLTKMRAEIKVGHAEPHWPWSCSPVDPVTSNYPTSRHQEWPTPMLGGALSRPRLSMTSTSAFANQPPGRGSATRQGGRHHRPHW